MKQLLVVTLLLCGAALALAAEPDVYVSACINGDPPSLKVLRFVRNVATANYTVEDITSENLDQTCGVTSMEHAEPNKIFVYATHRNAANKIFIVRRTLIKEPLAFDPNDLKTYPTTFGNPLNFHTAGPVWSRHQAPGDKKINVAKISPNGALKKAAKKFRCPSDPFSNKLGTTDLRHQLNTSFLSTYSPEPNTNRTLWTLFPYSAPQNGKTFVFTNQQLAHDITLPILPITNPDVYSHVSIQHEVNSGAPGYAPWILQVRSSDLTPLGGAVRLDKNRPNPNPSTYSFNGIAINQEGTLIVYSRHNAGCGSNEVVAQTFNPVTGKKIKKAKVALKCVDGFVAFGLDALTDEVN